MNSNARRGLLKKAIASTATIGVASAMPSKWVKPVVDTIVVPAHAMCTPPIAPTDCDCIPRVCGTIDIAHVSGPDPLPGSSNGDGAIMFQITSSATPCDTINITSMMVDNGTLSGATSGMVDMTMPFPVGWIGEVSNAFGIPTAVVTLTVNWVCSTEETFTSTYDLQALTPELPGVVEPAAAPAPPKSLSAAQVDTSSGDIVVDKSNPSF